VADLINIKLIQNDADGSQLRDAFRKINAFFLPTFNEETVDVSIIQNTQWRYEQKIATGSQLQDAFRAVNARFGAPIVNINHIQNVCDGHQLKIAFTAINKAVAEYHVGVPASNFSAIGADSDGIMQVQLKGIGTPEINSNVNVWQTDYEGIFHNFWTNNPVWKGTRFVENLLSHSEEFNNSDWLENGGATVDGKNQISFSALATDRISQANTDILAGGNLILSAQFTAADVGKVVRFSYNDSVATIQSADITITAPSYRIAFADTLGVNNLVWVAIENELGGGAKTLNIQNMQLENATGRADLITPSEYNFKEIRPEIENYNIENGNSVASGVVTENKGAPFTRETTTNGGDWKWDSDLGQSIYPFESTNGVGVDGPEVGAWIVPFGHLTIENNNLLMSAEETSPDIWDWAFYEYLQLIPNRTYVFEFEILSSSAVSYNVGDDSVYHVTGEIPAGATGRQQVIFTVGTITGLPYLEFSTGRSDAGEVTDHARFKYLRVHQVAPELALFGYTDDTGTTLTNNIDYHFDTANHSNVSGCWAVKMIPGFPNQTNPFIYGLITADVDQAGNILYLPTDDGEVVSWDNANLAANTGNTWLAGETLALCSAYGDGNKQVGVNSGYSAEGNFNGAFNVNVWIQIGADTAEYMGFRELTFWNMPYEEAKLAGQQYMDYLPPSIKYS